MKCFVSLMLLLAMAVAFLLPMEADAATQQRLKIEPAKEFRFRNPKDEQPVFTVKNLTNKDIKVTVEVYDQAARKNVQTMNFTVLPGDAPTPVMAYVYKALKFDGEVNTYRYTIKAPGVTQRHYYAQKLRITKDKHGKNVYTYSQYLNVHFSRNTVSSFGPHFRDVTPGLTDKWYMFTPIDLSIQGRQTFVLAASNMYEVGEVFVDVFGDQVTVSYRMFHSGEDGFTTEVLSEFITFYNSYADVGIVEPEEMPGPSAFAFNQPFSIQQMLGGDTNVLMFIRNRITYFRFPAPKAEYVRFWENKEPYASMRERMLQMMDPIQGFSQVK